MKKKSILLTAALIVIAILAGCSDQVAWPDMPQKVNDAQVIPREGAADILEGQAFDASKFSVMVIYDNGKSEVLNTLTVYEKDGNFTANNGEKLYAVAGLDVDNMKVYAEGTLVAYRINYITAEVKGTTYTNAAGIPASDVVVTAHYFDSKNAEKTMVLSSNEYELVVEDVSQPNVYDAIVTLEDTAKITKDGAVVGGNKIKIGLPITLEGADYRLNGTVSNIQLTHGTDEAVNDQQLSAVENVQ